MPHTTRALYSVNSGNAEIGANFVVADSSEQAIEIMCQHYPELSKDMMRATDNTRNGLEGRGGESLAALLAGTRCDRVVLHLNALNAAELLEGIARGQKPETPPPQWAFWDEPRPEMPPAPESAGPTM